MSFNKPIILCLHGGGTNTLIFTIQVARIRRILDPLYKFVFADGPVPDEPGPGVLPVFEGCGPYLRWVPPPSFVGEKRTGEVREAEEKKIDLALAQALDDEEGQVVGVMGFSAGAALATELLLRRQRAGPPDGAVLATEKAWRHLQFGVLMNGVAPPWRGVGEGERVGIPTVHVHGLSDPWLEPGRTMWRDCFEAETAKVMEFEGSHQLPFREADNEKLTTLILEAAAKGKHR